MRAMVVIAFMGVAGIALAQTPDTSRPPGNDIVFKDITHNFGTINPGTTIEHTFVFTNGGENPVEIADVKTLCLSCTVTYTKGKIISKKTGLVKVVYNSMHEGTIDEKFTILSNSKPVDIFLTGKVTNKDIVQPPVGTTRTLDPSLPIQADTIHNKTQPHVPE